MSVPDSMTDFPPLLRSHVEACTFSSWYSNFRKHSPKATIIKPLEDKFIDYLESDRVFIPAGSGPIGISELSDDDESGNGSDSSDDQSWQVTFPELDAHIRKIIVKYDGAVFPKLNWTSPQDAAWMVPGPALKCQSPADVYLLLKSSDFISHDLDHAFEMCVDRMPVATASESTSTESKEEVEVESLVQSTSRLRVVDENSSEPSSDDDEVESSIPIRKTIKKKEYEFELVLKMWFDMPKSQEWRCFVREKKLIAISQRDPNYYEFLQPLEIQLELKEKIIDFYDDEINPKFPLDSYTFDVYFTRSNDRVFLIDFNPFGPQTDSYLFPWSTLLLLHQHRHSSPTSSSSNTSTDLASEEESQDLPLMRIVISETMSSNHPSFAHNRYPKDVVDTSSGASIAKFAEEWKKKLEEGVNNTLREKERDREREREEGGR